MKNVLSQPMTLPVRLGLFSDQTPGRAESDNIRRQQRQSQSQRVNDFRQFRKAHNERITGNSGQTSKSKSWVEARMRDIPSGLYRSQTSLHTEVAMPDMKTLSDKREAQLVRTMRMLPRSLPGTTGHPVPYAFDMSDLPHIDHLRSLIVVMCGFSFFIAPFVYMPLGNIQATYGQKCFLFAELHIRVAEFPLHNSSNPEQTPALQIDHLKSRWGPDVVCDYTTFTAVSVAIFSVIIGWSALQIWPPIMSVGKGGALAVVYTVLSMASFAANFLSSRYIRFGFRATCNSLHMEHGGVATCHRFLYNLDIVPGVSGYTDNIYSLENVMVLVKAASWCLTGLAGFEILLSVYTFGVIWYYCYYDPMLVYEIPVLAVATPADSTGDTTSLGATPQ
ncbi:uncharacterized protein LOC101854438 [Aplysia californica]|uniref:Uncharacterized protein LOC101854438 n=1 Tax=Aplysia californica TaxID=6500 RepID=A0ABM1A862_APLCA|nr:uncharacterized protein LOC101854438 [Aplysia californica]